MFKLNIMYDVAVGTAFSEWGNGYYPSQYILSLAKAAVWSHKVINSVYHTIQVYFIS